MVIKDRELAIALMQGAALSGGVGAAEVEYNARKRTIVLKLTAWSRELRLVYDVATVEAFYDREAGLADSMVRAIRGKAGLLVAQALASRGGKQRRTTKRQRKAVEVVRKAHRQRVLSTIGQTIRQWNNG